MRNGDTLPAEITYARALNHDVPMYLRTSAAIEEPDCEPSAQVPSFTGRARRSKRSCLADLKVRIDQAGQGLPDRLGSKPTVHAPVSPWLDDSGPVAQYLGQLLARTKQGQQEDDPGMGNAPPGHCARRRGQRRARYRRVIHDENQPASAGDCPEHRALPAQEGPTGPVSEHLNAGFPLGPEGCRVQGSQVAAGGA